MNKSLILSALAVSMLAGCVTTQGGASAGGQMDNKTVSTGAGAALGCVGGAILASLAGGKPLAGCAAGALLGGLIGYEKARQEEIAVVRKTQDETVARVSGAVASPIITEDVQVRDKTTGEIKKVQAIKEFSIDLPLSQKNTPEFNSAMDKVQKLAEKYADERGSAQITVAMNSKDANVQKFNEQRVNLKSPSGKGDITFVRSIDSEITKGYERITVKSNNSGLVDVS